jgi:hypothetical protein
MQASERAFPVFGATLPEFCPKFDAAEFFCAAASPSWLASTFRAASAMSERETML